MRITGPGRNYACSVCGYQHVGPNPPKKCPQCGVDDNVWLLGSSVKDMGRGLTTIIRTEINPEYILGCVRM